MAFGLVTAFTAAHSITLSLAALLYAARRSPLYAGGVLRLCSALIAAVAGYWLLQRLRG